ncbi:MAG: hypothetical protein EP349_07705 [Alphaproteobacteria bacterium]|nr:MAG: hypothetical protein EP349_07705 [Alphaproteobacteria bacterium]
MSGVGDFLRDAFSGNKSDLPKARIVVVQDASNVQKDAKSVAKSLKKKGKADISIESFEYGDLLRDHLKKHTSDPNSVPETFFLDCCGAGHRLGLEIAEWFEENRPEDPLPAVYFLSLSTSMALEEAASLTSLHPKVKTGYVSEGELSSVRSYLDGESADRSLVHADTRRLRMILNEMFDTEFPMEVDEKYHESWEKQFQRALQGGIFKALEAGKVTDADVIEYWRTYATNLAQSLQTGLYGAKGGDVETDAGFYEGTGFPVTGAAVFSLEAVENWPSGREDKPILVMQSYDPEVVPLLDTGKLGGIVLCGPYLASHLAFLCDANKVTGVFGLVPSDSGEVPGGEFNQMAKSHLAPYFEEGRAEINGTVIEEGQKLMIGVGKNGLVFRPETIEKLQETLTKPDNGPDAYGEFECEQEMKRLQSIFARYFAENGGKVHSVKANVDSPDNPFLRLAGGIGLVRTEQVAAGYAPQANALREVLLTDSDNAHAELRFSMEESYRNFIYKMNASYPVKIRLFDLSPKELFNREDQVKFHEKYGSYDIHGGKALETWPKLYKEQVNAVFEAFKATNMGYAGKPLQVMMPAVRTEADTLMVKEMVEDAAQNVAAPKGSYNFGVMIETLDGCKNAADIIKHCDFISFGTNDLTQQALDVPRDDLRARARYEEKHGFDPYKKLAPEVMVLIQQVCEVARATNPKIEIDICGGQAADPDVAMALFEAGVDNLSVAPSQANLRALPLMLNYRQFDRMKNAQPNMQATAKHKHGKHAASA